MLVWRIENNEDRIGPYNSEGKDYRNTHAGFTLARDIYALGRDGISWDRFSHYAPQEDGLGRVQDGEFCGFKSLQQMVEWFPKDIITRLYRVDFSIVTFNVPLIDLRQGSTQVLFHRDDHEETRKPRGLDVLSRIR